MVSRVSRPLLLRQGILAAVLLVSAVPVAAQTAKRSADAAERSADPQDRMICTRFVETGSLVKGYKSCKTKREWERERDAINTQRAFSGSCNSAESGTCGAGPI